MKQKELARIARKKIGGGEKLTESERNAYNKWLSDKMGRCNSSDSRDHDDHRRAYNLLKEWPES